MQKLLDRKVALPSIMGVSALAIAFLFWLIYYKDTQNVAWASNLAAVNASLNALSSFFLVRGFLAVKNGQIEKHENAMKMAFMSSALFLVSYIVYHNFHGDTKFLAQGAIIRPVYFFTLISHIGLSIVALPMVLTTFYFSLTDQIATHRKWAKWTFPLWLYVSVTGVLIFVLIKLFNPAQ